MRTASALVLVLAACAAPPRGPQVPAATVPVQHRLEAGSVVAVAPARVSSGPEGPHLDARVFDGLLREALRQSPRLDFAAGVEAGPSVLQLVASADGDAGNLATSLLQLDPRTGQPAAAPLPLATVVAAGNSLTAAVDALARATRQALGDDGPASPIAAIYSGEPRCVAATEDGLRALAAGRLEDARRLLEGARVLDPGCTVTLAALATALLEAGGAAEATRIANETLRHLQRRLAPTTELRLARVLLLARAALADPVTTRQLDEKLLELGEASVADRPHDPHAHFTRALGLNYLGRFAESVDPLRALHRRWPEVGAVAYHLAFAEIATGEPAAALDLIEAAAGALPRDRALLPWTLAAFHAGRTDRLREELTAELARADATTPAGKVHELHRMLASVAITAGDREAAVRHLLADLDWLRHNPSLLAQLALEIGEAGEVLVALGESRALGIRIEALQPMTGGMQRVAQALIYLAGLVLLEDTGEPPVGAIETLTQERSMVWATLLHAAVYHRRGEVVDETRELKAASEISDSPLVLVALARALQALGRTDGARRLLDDVRKRSVRIDLRRPRGHPLFSPGRAWAYVASR